MLPAGVIMIVVPSEIYIMGINGPTATQPFPDSTGAGAHG